MDAVQIRPMCEADLEAVALIESRSYRFPWSKRLLGSCLHAGYYCCVMEAAGQLCGYAILTHAAGEAHVLNVCVAPEFQGKGLGRRLLKHLIGFCRYWNDEVLILEVRKSNQVAKNLYASLGFETIGTRRDYYRDGTHREDAIVMRMRLRDAVKK